MSLADALDKLDTFELDLDAWTEGRTCDAGGLVLVDEADLADLLSQVREVLRLGRRLKLVGSREARP